MEITFFNEEVEDFVRTLDRSMRTKVVGLLDILQECGYTIRMPFSRSIGGGLFELRVRGTIEVRLLYIYRSDVAMILHVFVKKSMTIPLRELLLARRRQSSLT